MCAKEKAKQFPVSFGLKDIKSNNNTGALPGDSSSSSSSSTGASAAAVAGTAAAVAAAAGTRLAWGRCLRIPLYLHRCSLSAFAVVALHWSI